MHELVLHDARDDLVNAAHALVASGDTQARWIFPEDTRLDPAIVDRVAAILRGATALQRVVLVHRSASVRFWSSALTLRVPNVVFEVERQDAPPAPAKRDTLALQSESAYTVRITIEGDVETVVARALEPAAKWVLHGLTIVLAGRVSLAIRSLGAALAAPLARIVGLQRVALVYSGVSIHGVATEIMGRCSQLRVRVCRSETEAADWLRRDAEST